MGTGREDDEVAAQSELLTLFSHGQFSNLEIFHQRKLFLAPDCLEPEYVILPLFVALYIKFKQLYYYCVLDKVHKAHYARHKQAARQELIRLRQFLKALTYHGGEEEKV